MSVQVENLEKNMAKLTIEVSAEELEKALQGAYLKQKHNISIPGFRKGKVLTRNCRRREKKTEERSQWRIVGPRWATR